MVGVLARPHERGVHGEQTVVHLKPVAVHNQHFHSAGREPRHFLWGVLHHRVGVLTKLLETVKLDGIPLVNNDDATHHLRGGHIERGRKHVNIQHRTSISVDNQVQIIHTGSGQHTRSVEITTWVSQTVTQGTGSTRQVLGRGIEISLVPINSLNTHSTVKNMTGHGVEEKVTVVSDSRVRQ